MLTRIHPVVETLVQAGYQTGVCCRFFGVSIPGYHKYVNCVFLPAQMRRQWVTGPIREVHTASWQTHGCGRVHPGLTLGMDVRVSERPVAVLLSRARSAGVPWPVKVKRLRGAANADELAHRTFQRLSPNELWVADTTEHPTWGGMALCCAVMDSFSRNIVGWSINNT